MTVTYSEDFPKIAKLCKSKTCKECGLYLNQKPIFDYRKTSKVFWVGLSAVQFNEDEEKLPLSPLTRSGALIHSIENPFKEEITFYKTNLVKCVPLKDEKIRYPLEHEMNKCFPNFEQELDEMNPSLVFMLGKQVSTFVFKKLSEYIPVLDDSFNYSGYMIGQTKFIPIHHPSYILVYKRKYIDKYKENIQRIISE
jgi:uracil-DNA glycosylase family 4